MNTSPSADDAPLQLPSETWGDLMKRAYRHGKKRFGYTYRELSERLSDAGIPISDQTLLRFEEGDQPPQTPRQLTNAIFYAWVMGYEAADLGLPGSTEMMKAFNVAYLRKVLDPRSHEPEKIG